MKRTALTALFVTSFLTGFAQPRDSVATRARVTFNPNSRRNGYENYQDAATLSGVGMNPGATINTIDHRYEGLRGSPYFIPSWNKGQIEMANGQTYTDVPLKFDAFQQQLVLLRTWAGSDSIVVNASQVNSFLLRGNDGQSYRFKHLPATIRTDDERLKEGYFMVLYDGKTTLLKRVAKRFKRADYKDPYSSNIHYDSFKEVDTYYLLKPDQTLTKIKLTKKSLVDALSEQQEALKQFVSQEQLSFGNEDDAIMLIKHYNQL